MKMQDKLAQYKSKAIEVFNAIKGDYASNIRKFPASSNYWQAGNVFDTLLDFMRLALTQGMIKQSDIDTITKYVSANYDIKTHSYSASIPDPTSPVGNWYDDFGWWGIAGSKANNPAYNKIFGATSTHFKQIAASCWGIMCNGVPNPGRNPLNAWGAPNVWARCDQKTFPCVEPLFFGGVWQNDITSYNSPLTHACGKPTQPGGQYEQLGPYQLSVVNGLFFTLGQRLAPQSILVANEYSFLTHWCFDPKVVNSNNSLMFRQQPGDTYGLIRERVTIYRNGSRVNPLDWSSVNSAWCGDQGLVLGGMIDYVKRFPNDKNANAIISLLLNGVPQYMSTGGVIQPWYPADAPLGSFDCDDYVSGVGVFFRYLLYAYLNNQGVKTVVNNKNSAINKLLFASADYCINNRYANCGGNTMTLFDYFNQLSTLTTAIEVMLGS